MSTITFKALPCPLPEPYHSRLKAVSLRPGELDRLSPLKKAAHAAALDIVTEEIRLAVGEEFTRDEFLPITVGKGQPPLGDTHA